jgi:urease accessory protein
MDLAETRLIESQSTASWRAELNLRYERIDGRTVLTERVHRGPLRVQKSLYPEGDAVCQNIIVHPPAGIVGGDALVVDVETGTNACTQLTTPGASKWYRSEGLVARQDIVLRVAGGAMIEWLPQGTIVFDGAIAQLDTKIDLAGDAAFIGWEIVCLGRAAAGERFSRGSWRQRLTIARDGAPVFLERCVLAGGTALLASPVGLNDAAVFGTFLASAQPLPEAALAQCRESVSTAGEVAATSVRGCVVARYRGPSVEAAQAYFVELWGRLRPLLIGRPAVPPRIWKT